MAKSKKKIKKRKNKRKVKRNKSKRKDKNNLYLLKVLLGGITVLVGTLVLNTDYKGLSAIIILTGAASLFHGIHKSK